MRLMFEEVRKNKIKSWFLIAAFLIVIANIGLVIGLLYGSIAFGIVIALVFSSIYILISYYSGDKLILKTAGAKEVTKKEYPHLFHVIEGLSLAAGIPKPKAYIIDDTALNAFATGRDPEHSSITVTTGLMNKLNRQELEGVIAHEMSHIKNYDIRYMMLTAVLTGLIILLSDFLLRSFIWGGGRRSGSDNKGGNLGVILIVVAVIFAILSPIIGQILKFSMSRKREYLADVNGALLTRYPPGLAGALSKISNDPDPLVDNANKATAHLFISTPFRKKKGFIAKLFMTHPPIEDRIKRLREM
jgi:heat shock protein HtpX